jgi:hypothetical protein
MNVAQVLVRYGVTHGVIDSPSIGCVVRAGQERRLGYVMGPVINRLKNRRVTNEETTEWKVAMNESEDEVNPLWRTQAVVSLLTSEFEVICPTETVALAMSIVDRLGLERWENELEVCQSRAQDTIDKWTKMEKIMTPDLRVKTKGRACFVHNWPEEFKDLIAWWCRYTSVDELQGKSLLEYLDENMPDAWREHKEDEPALFHSSEDGTMIRYGMEDRGHPIAAINEVSDTQARAVLLRLRLDGNCSGASTVRRWLDDDTHRVEDEGIIAKRLLECIFHPSTFALIDEEQELAHAQEQGAQPPMAQPAVPQDDAMINEGSQEADQQSEQWGNPMWRTCCVVAWRPQSGTSPRRSKRGDSATRTKDSEN